MCHSEAMSDSETDLGPNSKSAFDTKVGIVITERSAERVCGRAPVDGNTQPYGIWHGGATAALVETLGSVGAVEHAGPARRAVGTELNVSHLRSVRSGWVHGVATALHLGASSAIYRVDLTDDDRRLIASGRLSCRILG